MDEYMDETCIAEAESGPWDDAPDWWHEQENPFEDDLYDMYGNADWYPEYEDEQ